MARMRDFEAEAEQALGKTWDEITRPFRHHDQAARIRVASRQPATRPGMIGTATAAPHTGGTMSVITDVEQFYAGAKNELAKFDQALPAALAKAKQFEASPFAALVEKAASAVLPPEAVDLAVGAADKVLDGLIGLYEPQSAQLATPAQDAQQQPATAAQ